MMLALTSVRTIRSRVTARPLRPLTRMWAQVTIDRTLSSGEAAGAGHPPGSRISEAQSPAQSGGADVHDGHGTAPTTADNGRDASQAGGRRVIYENEDASVRIRVLAGGAACQVCRTPCTTHAPTRVHTYPRASVTLSPHVPTVCFA